MAQTKIRIAEQLQASTNPRSILITDSSSKPAYHAPTTGADTILFWDDSATNWAPLTIGSNLSITGTTLNASAGAGGYAEVQEEGTPLTARTKINFVGSGITATDDAGNTRTNVTLATKLNNIVDNATLGLIADTGAGGVAARTITGTTSRINVSNGNGQSGNPTIDIDTSYVGQTSITTLGTITTGTWNATQIGTNYGGTGLTGAFAVGDILYASSATLNAPLAKRNIGSPGNFLRVSGGLPVWTTAAAADLSDGANIAHINATETISAVWTFNTLPESSAAPTTGNQFTNKTYVDSLIANQRKLSVRAATTASITLSGTQTIDTVSVIAGDRVLVKNQGTQAQNGIYVVAAGAWSRAADMDAASEVDGTFVVVEDGGQEGTLWLTVSEVTNLGTDAIVFTQVNKATDLVAGAGITPTGLTWDIVKADDSLTINANDMAVRLHTTGGLETIASNGIRIKSDTVTAATVGITTTANGAGIKYDSNSFTDTSEILALANGVAGNGLALNTGVLSVNVDNSTIEINADSLRVKDAGITFAKIQNVNEDRLLGRDSGTLGAPEEISLTAGIGFIGSNTKTIGHTTTGASTVTHTNAQVPSVVTIDSYGHVTGFTTRDLALSNLSGVSISGPTTNQVLTYNGSNWVNQTAQGGTTVRAFVEGSTSSSIDLDANTGVVKDVNGNNVAFTVPSDTLKFFVYRNGIRQMETGGAPGNTTRDYSVNTTTHVLTLTYALTADEVLMVEKLN